MNNGLLNQKFGSRVRNFRRLRGLSQTQLAKIIGKSLETVSNIERGKTATTTKTASLIADALAVDLWVLYRFPGETENERERSALIDKILELVKREDSEVLSAVVEQIRILLSIKRM